MNSTTSILFILVSYSSASFGSNRPISTSSSAMEERLAFLQGAFWKQQTFQHGAVRARISREQNAFARCGCVQAAPSFGSRLFLGYPNRMLVLNAIAASRIEMVTASIRRISLAGEDESLVDVIPKHIRFLPNTAGCQTANDCFDSPETGMARLL
jgi:hypothetical protein